MELAPLSDPALVPSIAARSLGLRELTGPQAISLLQEYLEHRQLLLILDNCEHVIEACARLADTLLQACPKLSILASSREALGIAGEVSFRVPPLALPEADQSPPIEVLAQYEAIRLFVDRAATASPGFTLTPANAPAILQVCQRLDGIPLAIELAAARVKLLQVAEIAQHLDDRFRLLTGGSRAALPRYQTLRASIDWSYELLSPAERTLLQRLSVFAGGWMLEGAEAVGCGDDLASCDVLELLGQLVDKSLVIAGTESGSETRYRMLETIRQYAHEKLVEAGQARSSASPPPAVLSRAGRKGGGEDPRARPGAHPGAAGSGAGQPAPGAGLVAGGKRQAGLGPRARAAAGSRTDSGSGTAAAGRMKAFTGWSCCWRGSMEERGRPASHS